MPDTILHNGQDHAAKERTIKIISHSTLFYWWPVWIVGFLMALWTVLDGHRMAIVPPGTVAETGRLVEGYEGPRDVLVVPTDRRLPLDEVSGTLKQPRLHVASHPDVGNIYVTVLVLVILITNVPLRGLWSVIAIMSLILASTVLALTGWWYPILQALGGLHVHMNAFGYLSVSVVLFIAWLVTFLLYDRQHYLIFSRGQFRVRPVIGGGETAYEVFGMVVHKRRDDLFRHWILGLGSGDLVIKTGGAHAQQIDVPNVLFVGEKLRQIQQMLQEREVVKGQLV